MRGQILLRISLVAPVLVLTLAFNTYAGGPVDPGVILATTTSTRDSGLLDVLIPPFKQRTGYVVRTIAVGTGKALAMGKRGDADILVTHAPAAEKSLVEAGWLVHRVQFMHN